MSLRQIENLYRKLVSSRTDKPGGLRMDPGARSEIFMKITDNTERLIKKMKGCSCDTKKYHDMECELRRLMLIETQVIIDDYIIARENGTLQRWRNMYGEIEYYVKKFHTYRRDTPACGEETLEERYGFYNQDVS